MSKSKKLTFNMLYNSADVKPVINTVTVNNIEVPVKSYIGLVDMIKFVREVRDSCFEDETMEYLPEAKDFAIRINTLVYYAGVAVPTDTSKAYDLLYGTDIYNMVFEHIDDHQYYQIMCSIDDAIEHKRELIRESHASEGREILGKINELIDSTDDAVDKMNSDEFRNMFSGLMNAQAKEDADKPTDNVVYIDSKFKK